MTNQTHTSARQPKKRSPMLVGGATIISFVALLYIVEAFDQLNGHRFDDNGIRPLETDGLWGILFAPLLHANWAHLAANTGPALVLGLSGDLGRSVEISLGDGNRVDRWRARHLADRQLGIALRRD